MPIEPLHEIEEADYRRIVTGYTSDEAFEASVSDTDSGFSFDFSLARRVQAFAKQWPFNPGQFAWYRSLLKLGLSFAAREDSVMRGLVISGTTEWSRLINVWELHVETGYQGRGLGRALLSAVEEAGRAQGYRAVSCETQNTNVPAIRFYRRVGYEPMAADLSFYGNDDIAKGEVSVFMRKALG
jgi:ribosomal protein S18 acetylase RimI-like enzyme